MIGPMIADAARCWIGTPYVHQMSVQGAGCDCLGLLRGVWRDILGDEPEPVPAYTSDWAEPDRIEVLLAAARRHLRERARAEPDAPGDVLLFRMRATGIAKHVGIVVETGKSSRFIHAYQGHGVVSSGLTQPWRRRIAARFAWDNS